MPSPDLIVDDDRCGDVALPVNPFVSNRYHFGMLLGVADLETEQAYHRGKTWLHNAWLHGPGVVWGLGVEVRAADGELVVRAGLAIDAHGRELRVTDAMCVDLRQWFEQRRPDDLEVDDHPDGGVTFTVHVELCHDSCLDRPVPSISEPCGDASFDTAYSRAVERGLPRIVGGPVLGEPEPSYPRLRQFFGQVAVSDPLVTDALDAVAAADAGEQPAACLAWFRRLAAEDVTALAPEEGAGAWSPVAGDGCVPLAEIAVHLGPNGDVVDDGDDPTTVDNQVRPSHVRTRTIQELLCHGHDPTAVPPGGSGGGEPTEAAPQAIADSATMSGRTVALTFTRPLDEATVTADAFEVTVLRTDGWHSAQITGAELDDEGTTVTLRLSGAPQARPARVVASGAGARPLLGSDGRVLSGVQGDRQVAGGADAAVMIRDESD